MFGAMPHMSKFLSIRAIIDLKYHTNNFCAHIGMIPLQCPIKTLECPIKTL